MAAGGGWKFFWQKITLFDTFVKNFLTQNYCEKWSSLISKSIFFTFTKTCWHYCDHSVNFLCTYKEFLECKRLPKHFIVAFGNTLTTQKTDLTQNIWNQTKNSYFSFFVAFAAHRICALFCKSVGVFSIKWKKSYWNMFCSHNGVTFMQKSCEQPKIYKGDETKSMFQK